eukprot:jgi/Bigna1/74580/fgenesh1_pg.29_\
MRLIAVPTTNGLRAGRAKSHNVKIIPMIQWDDNGEKERFITAVLAEARRFQFDGMNIDFESGDPTHKGFYDDVFSKLRPLLVARGVGGPEQTREWVRERFYALLGEMAHRMEGEGLELSVNVDDHCGPNLCEHPYRSYLDVTPEGLMRLHPNLQVMAMSTYWFKNVTEFQKRVGKITAACASAVSEGGGRVGENKHPNRNRRLWIGLCRETHSEFLHGGENRQWQDAAVTQALLSIMGGQTQQEEAFQRNSTAQDLEYNDDCRRAGGINAAGRRLQIEHGHVIRGFSIWQVTDAVDSSRDEKFAELIELLQR